MVTGEGAVPYPDPVSLSIYVAAPEGRTGKSIVALGIIDALSRQVASIGVFRPLIKGDKPRDEVLESLLRLPGVQQDYASAVGVTYAEARANPDDVLGQLMTKFGELKERFEAIVVVGSDYAGTTSHNELALNARFAANFGAPMVLTIAGKGRTPEQVKAMALSTLAEVERHHARAIGIVATRLEQEKEADTLEQLSTIPNLIVSAVETDPSLSSPNFGAQVMAAEAELLSGRREQLDRESRGVMIAAMTLPNALKGLFHEATVVVPGDRFEMIPSMLMAHNSTSFPDLTGLILVGGYELPESITKLIGTIRHDLPIAVTRLTTWQVAQKLFAVEGAMTNSPRKAELALAAVSRTIDIDALIARASEIGSAVTTPLMFEYKLNEMARRHKRTIVLPEADDDRILTSAAIALKRGIAGIILLGKPEVVLARAAELDLDLTQAEIVDPEDPELIERFASEYARLRAHKGVTVEAARSRFADKSYVGTMMVHMGIAHGMVSGAVNTTANTIRPSLEFIKTKPGVKVVSSSFLMCMDDRVDVYADCAVNPNPTPEELADIAIGAAETARAFGIEPRVAMLSYSTGTSGAGSDVEAVAEATRLVKEREPGLAVDGPIQFDAAVDLTVGQKKMPGSAVAGRATVFIFPDLNTGNNTYKAVQRTAGAVAIGPVLQGLNKPVNDLSRGALVDDIVNTIAITAIQAQQQS